MTDLASEQRTGVVRGLINYTAPMAQRPRFYANDLTRNRLALDPQVVDIADARRLRQPPSLDREGFQLVDLPTNVAEFRDAAQVQSLYQDEVRRALQSLTHADLIVINSPGVLRFSERSAEAGTRSNSWPARFVHVDVSEATARAFAERALGGAPGGPGQLGAWRRYAHYNIWRAFSAPPQDVPLAICDATSVRAQDLMAADAVFDPLDPSGAAEWEFEGLVVRQNPDHRWFYYRDMRRGEAIVFKTFDSDPAHPRCCPHTGFDDPTCPGGAAPRESIEMRAVAFFRD
jgi:hypothetical protein